MNLRIQPSPTPQVPLDASRGVAQVVYRKGVEEIDRQIDNIEISKLNYGYSVRNYCNES